MRATRTRRLVWRTLPAGLCFAVAGFALWMAMELILVPAPLSLCFLVLGMAAGGAGCGLLCGRFGVGTLVGLAFGAFCAAALVN